MNISSMLDYIRNPFAAERVSAVVGKIKISNKKIMNISSTLGVGSH